MIKLLDCTLRDGGYVNDWNFGKSTANYILESLINAKVDFIEIGLLDQRVEFDINKTIVPNTNSFSKIFNNIDKKTSKIFAMIDYGTCGIENIEESKDNFIDGIRIIFKKVNMYKAIDLAKQIKEKGYLVSLQLVSTTSYTDREILDFCDEINKLNPYSVAIVDTYGLMHKEELFHYFEILNHNIRKGIVIGYHSHNNFQLAYANSIELLKINKNREIAIDGSIYGMGKSAGNAPSELLAMHLNEFYKTDYKVDYILEALDSTILKIYKKYYWGYSFKYYLSALNDCHPNYINYLIEKKTLSIKAVNEIISQIEKSKKLNYDENHIENIYKIYQANKVDDEISREKLKNELLNKNILLLAPGKTLATNQDDIQKYIKDNNCIVIAINNIVNNYKLDYIFISNSKRYSSLFYNLSNFNNLIATSNITPTKNKFKYTLDYNKLIIEDGNIVDNSMLMFLQFLIDIGQKEVSIAGFDGFLLYKNSYYDEYLEYEVSTDTLELMNQQIKDFINKDKININFITPSIFKEEKENV
ncbi:aldolase catalytic domain-containing protein [Arcobacter porcinus]|uniref:DRE_TIM_HOA_like domain-containing protein n=1 Tax=Arcobacter porcinus TaxID=1935204 RepID=A0A5C2HM22_9BACT|nr:aldolase catalytic domain-containing protein [Arcobacter porcinus]OCL94374.1 4-hydroxy-2-oxovalerate aldolase [Aliarcobacter thereius]QEP41278.1 DRE_TIM_HOA_like domain-containing protein [Arcobacter porcinus]